MTWAAVLVQRCRGPFSFSAVTGQRLPLLCRFCIVILGARRGFFTTTMACSAFWSWFGHICRHRLAMLLVSEIRPVDEGEVGGGAVVADVGVDSGVVQVRDRGPARSRAGRRDRLECGGAWRDSLPRVMMALVEALAATWICSVGASCAARALASCGRRLI